jgi:hypothetical protein
VDSLLKCLFLYGAVQKHVLLFSGRLLQLLLR